MTPEQTSFVQGFYEENHDTMLYVANKIVRDPYLAADVVSQAFLVLILRIEVVMACDDPAKWAFHVLKNLAIDEYRRARRQIAVPLECVGILQSETDELTFQTLLPTGLTAEEREILTLRIDLGLDYDEIARRLGATNTACRMKYSRARKRCAELMK